MRDTIDMAREAGIFGEFDTVQDIIECGIEVWLSGKSGILTLERFVELVRTDEREACARVCDIKAEVMAITGKSCDPDDLAAAIRARGSST